MCLIFKTDKYYRRVSPVQAHNGTGKKNPTQGNKPEAKRRGVVLVRRLQKIIIAFYSRMYLYQVLEYASALERLQVFLSKCNRNSNFAYSFPAV
jgi:hypothetical protein